MLTGLHPAGSWGVVTSDDPAADFPDVMALPGSWPIGAQPQAFVRRDQWVNLIPEPPIDPPPED